MWIEALVTSDDLERLLARALPLTVQLGDGHSLDLYELASVKLVTGEGMRAACKARVHWPVIGVELPIVLHSLDILLRPFIDETGERLVFGIQLEHADVAGIPTLIDNQITSAINTKLAEHHLDLGWDFSGTLTHLFSLPKMIEPLDALALRVAWGKVRITEEGFVLAISFHADVIRENEPHHALAARQRPLPRPPSRAIARSLPWREAAVVGSAFGAAACLAFLGLRGAARVVLPW